VRNLLETSTELKFEIQRRVWGSGDYDEQHLDPTELSSRIMFNIDWLLSALADDTEELERLPGFAEACRVADEIGTRRAVQAVGVDAVIRSWRTAERLLEERIIALSGDVDPAELLAAVKKLGILVGRLTDESVEGYRRVQQEVGSHYDRLTSDLMARIVSGSGLSATEVEQRSALIQADPTDEYLAVAIGISEREDTAMHLHAQRHLLSHLGMRVAARILVGSFDDRPLLLVPTRRVGEERLRELLDGALHRYEATRPLALGASARTARLGDSHETARQARLALDVAQRLGRTGVVVSYEAVAVEALLLREPATARVLVEVLRPLFRRPELVETLRAYFGAGHSARAAARKLFVHPNTVPHRLATISRLIGRDLDAAGGNLDVLLALRWLELHPEIATAGGAIET
jgi:sugar diacid utilization regulator